MKAIVFIFVAFVLSKVDGQTCTANYNSSIVGKCLPINECQGTILATNTCNEKRCCVSPKRSFNSSSCFVLADFDILYNTSRAQFLGSVLSYGMNITGICSNCQAKAAFLAIATTMTDAFQSDEAVGNSAQFSSDDNKYGNSQAGDGSRFRRRGFFGVRGRTMYERLQVLMPQYQSLNNTESISLVENAIFIASKLWSDPNLNNVKQSNLTRYADGSFYGFSMIWYELGGDMDKLATAAKYYSKYLRQLKCGGDLYPGQGPKCQYNRTHDGFCAANCIKGLEDSGSFCGCSNSNGKQCDSSPKHVRCCLNTCYQDLKMDLGIVLDASGSIVPEDYKLQIEFTKELLYQANVGHNKTHVGIINYSSSFTTLTWLNKDYSLNETLTKLRQAKHYGESTNTTAALQQVNKVFNQTNGRRPSSEGVTSVVFVITDGQSDQPNATIRAADFVKRNGIVLISVGVGSGPSISELHAICTPPASENYFAISNYNALAERINQFTSRSCSEPINAEANATITTDVNKDKYKFFKIQIDAFGKKFLVVADLLRGKVKLFYSFTNHNPKDPEDFIDYSKSETTHNFDELIRTRSTDSSSSSSLTINKPEGNFAFVYVGVKGLSEENQFKMKLTNLTNGMSISSNSIFKFNMISSVVMIMFTHF